MHVPARVANEALVAERRATLVKAATVLFLHNGFHSTSVREIANAAGWQMGTLYLYISQKEDILYLIAEEIMNNLSAGLLRLSPRPDATTTLREAFDYFFHAVAKMRREVKLLYRESASLLPEHLAALQQSELDERDFIADIIRRGIEDNEFRPIDPEFLSHSAIMLAHMWALKGWALHEHIEEEHFIRRQIHSLMMAVAQWPQSLMNS